jgi:deoxyhypusine synthase
MDFNTFSKSQLTFVGAWFNNPRIKTFTEELMKKRDYLKTPVEHIDIKLFNAADIIDAMRRMSFSARDLAQAADIYDRMLRDKDCAIILTIAGSTSAAGCMQIYTDLVKHNMVDVVVATGATIVDMDFFEALGFKHYQGTSHVDDRTLRKLYIDRIYDTFIAEEELQACDKTITEIADSLPPGPYSSREFIHEMGRYLARHATEKESLFQVAY